MSKPYETKRELIDDLLLLYGQVAGAAAAGQNVNGAALIEKLGEIIARAHKTPAGHQANVARAREAEAKATKPLERPDLQRRLYAVK